MKNKCNNFQLEVLTYAIVSALHLPKCGDKGLGDTIDQVRGILEDEELRSLVVDLANASTHAELDALRKITHGSAMRTSLHSAKQLIVEKIVNSEFADRITAAYSAMVGKEAKAEEGGENNE